MALFKIEDGNTIKLVKEITELDKFVLRAINIIKKYAKYVIVSGYVSIFLGRNRATEDVDLFLEEISFDKFKELYEDFLKNGYTFTVNDVKSLYYDYLKDKTSINVWEGDSFNLRLEIKLASRVSQRLAVNNPTKIIFGDNEILIASVESQIAYKRFILKSDKDLEDAKHLEIVFENLDKNKINNFRVMFENEFNNG